MEELTASRIRRGNVADADHVAIWLADFESALRTCDRDDLALLFADECHWRDLLAFTWNITPHEGAAAIVDALIERQLKVQCAELRSGQGPHTTAGSQASRRRGHRSDLRVRDGSGARPWRRPAARGAAGQGLGADDLAGRTEGPRGADRTAAAQRVGLLAHFRRRQLGGSAREGAGLRRPRTRRADRRCGSGRAERRGEARPDGRGTLVVDKLARVGDVWRQRYHSLALHNQVALNHMPYMPFPPSWPKYLPKDMIGNWLETYAWAMECNVWTGTSLVEGRYDDAAGRWNARVRRADGSERVLHPRHIVFANGVVGAPTEGRRRPASTTSRAKCCTRMVTPKRSRWRGKNALVLGAGTSGHDVAQDLPATARTSSSSSGVRSPSPASTRPASTTRVYYNEGLPLRIAT